MKRWYFSSDAIQAHLVGLTLLVVLGASWLNGGGGLPKDDCRHAFLFIAIAYPVLLVLIRLKCRWDNLD